MDPDANGTCGISPPAKRRTDEITLMITLAEPSQTTQVFCPRGYEATLAEFVVICHTWHPMPLPVRLGKHRWQIHVAAPWVE